MKYNDQRLLMTLSELRKEIDLIDNELLTLIGKRITVVKKIGEFKKETGKPVKDAKREEEKIEILIAKNENKLLSKESITKIWKTFFEIAYKIEE